MQALARTIESQQKLLEDRGDRSSSCGERSPRLAGSRGRPSVEDTSSAQAHLRTQVAGVEPAAATDQSPARVSEVPPDIVTAGDFPGAVQAAWQRRGAENRRSRACEL